MKINEQVSWAQSHADDALNMFYDVWEENRHVIKGEEPEQILFDKVYNGLLEKELLDTCFSNTRASYMAVMPDDKLLFADYWRDKTCVLQENNDTLHLLEDDYDWYKFDVSGRYMAFGKDGTYVMDLETRQVDTLKNIGGDLAFIGKGSIISYVDEGTIRFFNVETKRDNVYKPKFLNHNINGLCYSGFDSCLATVSNSGTILFHNLETDKWATDTIAKNLGKELKKPVFIGKKEFAIQIKDTLKVWPISRIGDSGYQKYWVVGYSAFDNPYSNSGNFYITAKDDVLKIFDLKETEKVYLTLKFTENIISACFSHDDNYIYVASRYNIYKIPIMSHEQLFRELERFIKKQH